MTISDLFNTPKLLHHLDRLGEWQSNEFVYPIMVSIDVTNVCNHDCPLCSSSKGSSTVSMNFDRLKELIKELGELGVRGVSYGGGGDCSVYPKLAESLYLIRDTGMQSGLYTNGQISRTIDLEAIADCATWARFSLDADGSEMHSLTHGTRSGAFDKVKFNIKKVVNRRNAIGSDLTIGTGFLVGSHTKSGIYGATRIAKDLGVDYMRLRPFFHFDAGLPFKPDEVSEILNELERAKADFETDKFKVSFPAHRTNWVLDGERPPIKTKCNIHHFSTIVEADFKVYLCYHFKGFDKYCIGDLKKSTFTEIWNSEKRRKIYENIDYVECAMPCNMQAHNDLLTMVETKPIHPNFL